MYTSMDTRSGGTNIQASRAFANRMGKPSANGSLGMLTVYKYGFEPPPPPTPPTPWGTYLLLGLAGWWAWTKWGRKV